MTHSCLISLIHSLCKHILDAHWAPGVIHIHGCLPTRTVGRCINHTNHKQIHCCCSVSRCVWLFARPSTAARQASLSFTISQSLLEQANQWCHPTIWSSVVPFFFRFQSFPASGSFPVSQFFASGGQSTGASASASASVLPVNIQDWFPLGWTRAPLLRGICTSQDPQWMPETDPYIYCVFFLCLYTCDKVYKLE